MLIALHGKKGHGKSTIAAHLAARHGFSRMRFAAGLKELLGPALFQMTPAQTDGFLKEAACVDLFAHDAGALAEETMELLPPGHASRYGLADEDARARWSRVHAPLCGSCRLHTPREVMQAVGGGARRLISERIWIDLWRDAYRASGAGRVVVDDLRYPDEKAAIEELGGEVWRSVRTDLPACPDTDPSETACDHLEDGCFAAALRRDGSVSALLAQVDSLVAIRLATARAEAS